MSTKAVVSTAVLTTLFAVNASHAMHRFLGSAILPAGRVLVSLRHRQYTRVLSGGTGKDFSSASFEKESLLKAALALRDTNALARALNEGASGNNPGQDPDKDCSLAVLATTQNVVTRLLLDTAMDTQRFEVTPQNNELPPDQADT